MIWLAVAVCGVLIIVGSAEPDAAVLAVIGWIMLAALVIRAVIIGITRLVTDEVRRR